MNMKSKFLYISLVVLVSFALPTHTFMDLFGMNEAKAVSIRTFDGGETKGVVEVCTCSGGAITRISSKVDEQTYNFVYQLGVTKEYDNNNTLSSGYNFLQDHFPIGICLIYVGNSCTTSQITPDGTIVHVGTSK